MDAARGVFRRAVPGEPRWQFMKVASYMACWSVSRGDAQCSEKRSYTTCFGMYVLMPLTSRMWAARCLYT